jgi:RNA polymerase sigma-70 factor (ECF subfamily)
MTAFATTRWSLILESRSDSSSARDALQELCTAYRGPVLAYVRHRGYGREEAEDLTQEFFAHFLSERIHHAADPARGRFRAYLLGALRYFLADQVTARSAQKRGGNAVHEPLGEHERDGGDQPERVFERHWALTVMQRALTRMRAEAVDAGKDTLFDELRDFLVEQPSTDDYERVCERLGMRRNTLAVAVHRMRHRLRELIRAELSDTVLAPEDVDEELGALREILGGAAA